MSGPVRFAKAWKLWGWQVFISWRETNEATVCQVSISRFKGEQ